MKTNTKISKIEMETEIIAACNFLGINSEDYIKLRKNNTQKTIHRELGKVLAGEKSKILN